MNYIYYNSRDEFVRLSMADIVYFQADGNYTKVVSANKLTVAVGIGLGEIEKLLVAQTAEISTTFIRVGKQFIVNGAFIHRINIQNQSLVLSDYHSFTYQLPVSKGVLRRMKRLLVAKQGIADTLTISQE